MRCNRTATAYAASMHDHDPLVRLLDEARASDAGATRGRERWLQRQAEEGATLAGSLLDLAERRSLLALRTSSGRVSRGAVVAVGSDFVALGTPGSPTTCVRLAAITTVRPSGAERHAAATGKRPPPLDLLLVEVLAGLAPVRPRVALVAGGEMVAGELWSVGADVVTLRLDGEPDSVCYVAATAIGEVLIEPV